MSSTFEAAIPVILQHEGGLVDNQHDKGGKTNYGISAAAFPFEDIPNLTRERAEWIYRQNYWSDTWSAFDSQDVATYLLDCAVNHGRMVAETMLQKAANDCGGGVTVDGHVGSATIAACNAANPEKLLTAFQTRRLEKYVKIIANDPTQVVFALGWIRRALG